jgi:hypothetical protein
METFIVNGIEYTNKPRTEDKPKKYINGKMLGLLALAFSMDMGYGY